MNSITYRIDAMDFETMTFLGKLIECAYFEKQKHVISRTQ